MVSVSSFPGHGGLMQPMFARLLAPNGPNRRWTTNPIVSMQPMLALHVVAVMNGLMQPVLSTQPIRYPNQPSRPATNRGVASLRTTPNGTNRPIAN